MTGSRDYRLPSGNSTWLRKDPTSLLENSLSLWPFSIAMLVYQSTIPLPEAAVVSPRSLRAKAHVPVCCIHRDGDGTHICLGCQDLFVYQHDWGR